MATGSIKKVSNDSTSGYCKMADGTLIQWGAGSVASTKGQFSRQSVSFAVPFTTVYPDMFVTGLTEDTTMVCTVSNRTATGAQISIHQNSSTRTIYFSWLAIGRWK